MGCFCGVFLWGGFVGCFCGVEFQGFGYGWDCQKDFREAVVDLLLWSFCRVVVELLL